MWWGRPSGVDRFRRLALRSATGTAQRTVPTWGPAGGRDGVGGTSGVDRFHRLTLRSATGTAQRTVPTTFAGTEFNLIAFFRSRARIHVPVRQV